VVTAALIDGQEVLAANTTPFLRRYDTTPLTWTIIHKAGVYCVFVLAARLIGTAGPRCGMARSSRHAIVADFA
jgi:hypothetical protein